MVELRRPRTTPTSTQAPAPIVKPDPPRPSPEEQRTITQASAASLNQLLREMTKVTERDPLMELVLIAVRPTAPRAALFAVKKDSFVGWICTSDFGERSALCLVQLDSRKPSILSSTATVGSYFGSVPRNEIHSPLSKVIKSSDPEVLGVAIKAAGRPVALLIAHDVAEPVRAMTVLTEVARVAGDTLEKILRARR